MWQTQENHRSPTEHLNSGSCAGAQGLFCVELSRSPCVHMGYLQLLISAGVTVGLYGLLSYMLDLKWVPWIRGPPKPELHHQSATAQPVVWHGGGEMTQSANDTFSGKHHLSCDLSTSPIGTHHTTCVFKSCTVCLTLDLTLFSLQGVKHANHGEVVLFDNEFSDELESLILKMTH